MGSTSNSIVFISGDRYFCCTFQFKASNLFNFKVVQLLYFKSLTLFARELGTAVFDMLFSNVKQCDATNFYFNEFGQLCGRNSKQDE